VSRYVKGEGPAPCTSLWCGLGPGKDEIRRGRVWVGPAGRLLNSLLWRENLDRADLYITNLRKTMAEPGDGGPYAEIEDLEYELMRVEPSVVVPMGREAARWFLGDVDLEAVHGIPWRKDGRTVVPIYNPAFALHDDEAYTYVAWDIHQVARTLRGEVSPRENRDAFPNPRYSVGFVPYMHPTVYVDTEGNSRAPWCLSYACIPGKAHVILATDRKGLAEFSAWLSRRKKVVMHSAMYDLAVLRAMGIHVRDDQIEDTKIKAYVTGGVEPQGLKPLGFRHAGMRMQSYPDLIAPYDFVQAMKYLERASEVDWGKPDPVLVEKGSTVRVKQPQSLNTRIRSIFTAIVKDEPDEDEVSGVNPRKRWEKIEPELRYSAEMQFGPMPEFTLDLLPFNEATYYAARDADATCRVDPVLTDLVMEGGHDAVYRTDIEALPIVERMQANGMLVEVGYFPKLKSFFNREMAVIRRKIEVFNGGKYINPESSKQTAVLLFDRLRLPVIKLTPKRQRSTADKVLETLKGRHPAVALICDWRELATLKDNFADKLVLYIQEDGRVRGNIRETTVKSGRYSMSEPNLMAIPVRTEVGKKIRRGFIAGPGMVLCGADFDQIELRVMADLGHDEGMIEAFIEGRDIHAETASLIFEVPIEAVLTHDGKLTYRYPAKRIGFGIATGITEVGLYDQYRLAGLDKYTVADCAEHIARYFKVRPGIKRMIDESRQMALRDGYVRDRGGRIRHLPGVYSSHPDVRGEALRQSHSHRVSGTAQWLKKRALARIWREIHDLPRWEVEPLLEIHDEVILEVKKGREKWVERMLLKAMSADSNLFAVPITAKVNFGPTWGDLKD
jgi:uracil-DNA glycosylase family 4